MYKLKIIKEIKDSLKIYYEGNENVQLRKIVALIKQYESFAMKDGELVDDMFGRI